MTEEKTEEYEHFSLTSSQETLPPYTTTRDNDVVVESNGKSGQGSIAWSLAWDTTKQRIDSVARSTLPFLRHKVWPILKKVRFTKKQTYAFLMLLLLGIGPFVTLAAMSAFSGYGPFYTVFAAKSISCGNAFGTPQNSTVEGWEALFVLDFTFGKLPFSQAKVVDVSWDLVIGRGAQLLAWWISYVVFSDALLRVIERHPSSYQTFAHICLEGPCMASMWALLKDLFRTRSKRTWSLYLYMLLSTFYVLCMPIFLSAMTGYVNSTVAWVDTDDTNNIIPAAQFRPGVLVYNAANVTMNNTCSASDQLKDWQPYEYERGDHCDCQLPNGTVMPFRQWTATYFRVGYNHENYLYRDCLFNFTGASGTFQSLKDDKSINCNGTYPITLFGKSYPVHDVNYTQGFCNGDRGYEFMDLMYKSRCLPDTADPSYQWGFSTMLSGVFVIFNFIWALVMYVVWQDAQFNSKLVKSGFAMTQLRAAFTLATAARWRTGMGNRELVRTDTKRLEEQLHGSREKMRAEVGYNIFSDQVESEDENVKNGLKKRRGRTRDGIV